MNESTIYEYPGVVLLTLVANDDLHNCSKRHPDDMHTLAITFRRVAGRTLRETISSGRTVYVFGYFETLA
jgi:hypothetical protein